MLDLKCEWDIEYRGNWAGVMDHKSFLKTLNANDKARLNARSDAQGLRHLMLYCAVLGVTGSWIFFALPLWQIMMIPHGILIAFLFTLQHECTHNTPFKTHWLNSVVGHVIAFLLFQPFLWFRYFHLAHHKYTNIAAKDPELNGGEKPASWGAFLRHLSTVDYWWAKITTLIGNSVGPLTESYIPPRKRRSPACRSGTVDCGLCRCFCNSANRPALAVDCAADPWVSCTAPLSARRTRTLPRG